MQSCSVSCWRLLCFQIGFSTNSVPGNKEGAKHGCPGLGWLCSARLVSQGHAAKAMGQRAVARGGCSLGLGRPAYVHSEVWDCLRCYRLHASCCLPLTLILPAASIAWSLQISGGCFFPFPYDPRAFTWNFELAQDTVLQRNKGEYHGSSFT